MANRAKYPDRAYGVGIERAYIRVTLPGSATKATPSLGAEIVKSVAHVGGSNVCTVTLVDSFPNVIALFPELRDDAGNGAYVTAGSITGEGSSAVPTAPISFKVNSFASGGSASNDDTHVVGIEVVFLNSNVTAGN